MLTDRPEARKKLETVVDQARAAIAEGRHVLEGLRSSTVVTNELAQAVKTIGEELATEQTDRRAPQFRVNVEGAPRNLPPILRDEVYRIACEGLRNAFRHAHARRIEVEIRYEQRQLRLRVRDDGKGMDQKVLGGGSPGHYGLAGLHERAKLAGGKLAVWSELDSGTEAELVIPGLIAYLKEPVPPQSLVSGRGA
jgi:signal transduction histidine kinase